MVEASIISNHDTIKDNGFSISLNCCKKGESFIIYSLY